MRRSPAFTPLSRSGSFSRVQLTLTTLAVAVVLVGSILVLVRRGKLREKYAVIWLTTGVIILPLAAFPRVLDSVALSLGIRAGTSLVLFLAVAFLLLLAMHLSWELSQLEEETQTLCEEVALIRTELRRQARQAEDTAGHVPSP
jgi:hypothetical protein